VTRGDDAIVMLTRPARRDVVDLDGPPLSPVSLAERNRLQPLCVEAWRRLEGLRRDRD
jgi:hypothetical protein